jgi:hypothetical protein
MVRFGEVAVSLGFVTPSDVESALQMQDYRRSKGQEVLRLGALLQKMGKLTPAESRQVAHALPNRPRPSRREKAIAAIRALQPTRARRRDDAPALEPPRRRARPKKDDPRPSVQDMLGWLAKTDVPVAPLRERRRRRRAAKQRAASQSPSAPEAATAKPTASPTPPPLPQRQPTPPRPQRSPELLEARAKSDRLAREVERLERELATAKTREAHARQTSEELRGLQAAACRECEQLRATLAEHQAELDKLTDAVILQEDLIDGLRDEVARLSESPRDTSLAWEAA